MSKQTFTERLKPSTQNRTNELEERSYELLEDPVSKMERHMAGQFNPSDWAAIAEFSGWGERVGKKDDKEKTNTGCCTII